MNSASNDEAEMAATLEDAGWERFEGEPEPGFFVVESPSGVRFRLPEDPRMGAMGARWTKQLAEEAALTPYQKRQRREADQRAILRDEAARAGWRQTYKAVRREAFRAIREGRTSNVVLFTPSAKHRRAGVQVE